MRPFCNINECSDLKGKYVLVRTLWNVPIDNGVVLNQFRILRGFTTIKFLVSQGAKVILCGHIGSDGAESTKILKPIYENNFPVVQWSDEVVGASTTNLRDNLQNGEILMLENLRKDPREKKNDSDFARALADLADVYVNDAFPVAHREHSSIVSVPKFLPAYAGHNFVHEYEMLRTADAPESPSLFMLGGAKFDTKLPLVEKFLDIYDHVFIGGALANDFFKARGYAVGESLLSDVDLTGSPLLDNPKLLLPADVTVTDGTTSRVTTPDAVASHERIMDAGPQTTAMLAPLIKNAQSILWNGPFGNYEAGFDSETMAVAALMADATGTTIVGGGDTVASIEALGKGDQFTFVSTAGGAMLQFLETKTLPGIEALADAATKIRET